MTASTRKQRVTVFLNALADLQRGDLLKVLKMDDMVPMVEPGLGESASLRVRTRTGEDLSRIVEQQLVFILGLGEASLFTCGKPEWRNDLGARRFV
jgi:hypothetical protein